MEQGWRIKELGKIHTLFPCRCFIAFMINLLFSLYSCESKLIPGTWTLCAFQSRITVLIIWSCTFCVVLTVVIVFPALVGLVTPVLAWIINHLHFQSLFFFFCVLRPVDKTSNCLLRFADSQTAWQHRDGSGKAWWAELIVREPDFSYNHKCSEVNLMDRRDSTEANLVRL